MFHIKKVLFVTLCLVLAGCSTKRPVLYPNDHLQKVGGAQAQKDIDECYRLAEAYLKSNPDAKVVKDAAEAGVVGGATGAAGGAVWGHAGKGAATGAAVGVAGGIMHGIFRASEPKPVYKNFVNRCLQEKGYDPIGWE
jgi:hypothetical protein